MRPLPRISKVSASILRRRTVRLRLTLLYSALFIASGAALVAIANVLVSYQLGSPVRIKSTPGSILSTPGVIHAPPGDSLQIQQAADLHQFLVWSWIALGMMAIVSIALGWLVAGRVLRPVRIMTTSARQISEHNLHERLALQGPRDEFKDLGDTIDGLLARLECAFDFTKALRRQCLPRATHSRHGRPDDDPGRPCESDTHSGVAPLYLRGGPRGRAGAGAANRSATHPGSERE